MEAETSVLGFLARHRDQHDPKIMAADAAALLCGLGASGVAIRQSDQLLVETGDLTTEVIEARYGVIRISVVFSGAPEHFCCLLEHLALEIDRCITRVEREYGLRKYIHDLKGALAIVSGQGEMLSSQLLGPLAPEQARAVTVLERQAERMRSLLEELRKY